MIHKGSNKLCSQVLYQYFTQSLIWFLIPKRLCCILGGGARHSTSFDLLAGQFYGIISLEHQFCPDV